MTPKRKTTRTCNHGRARQWDPRVACTRLPSKSCKILRVLFTPPHVQSPAIHVIVLISGISIVHMHVHVAKANLSLIKGWDRGSWSDGAESILRFFNWFPKTIYGNWEVTIGMRLWAKWLELGLTKTFFDRTWPTGVFCCTCIVY